jgi:hypothetical protein
VIPVATTRITVLRNTADAHDDEPYGGHTPADRAAVAQGVRAVIDRPTGSEQVAGGEQSRVDLMLHCDPCDIDYRDLVRDERTGAVYRVVFVLDFGMHLQGGLQIVEGEV